MDNALFSGLVNGGLCRIQCGDRLIACIFSDSGSYILDDVFHPGFDGFIAQPFGFGLPGAFEC